MKFLRTLSIRQLADVRELTPVPWKGARGFFVVAHERLPAEYTAAWRELEGIDAQGDRVGQVMSA